MTCAKASSLTLKRVGAALGWLLVFLRYALTTILIGSVFGGVLFLALKPLFNPELSRVALWSRGVKNGCIYSAYWSFSIALVLCVLRWKRTRAV